MKYTVVILLMFFGHSLAGQSKADSLKQEILQLQLDVQKIELGLQQGQKRFQSGILVSAIGYSVTIAGGMMLGRENDKMGQVLLITGGTTGLVGTYLLVDSFNLFSGRRQRKQ